MPKDEQLEIRISKQSVFADQRLVGGVAYFSVKGGDLLIDTQGHGIPPQVLREALHDFMSKGSRVLCSSHARDEAGEPVCIGEIVEAAVLGGEASPPGWNPEDHAMWIMAKVSDEAEWQRVKSQEYLGFSIGGLCTGTEVDVPDDA